METTEKQVNIDLIKYFNKGISYENYVEQFNLFMEKQNSLLPEERDPYFHYMEMNQHRMKRAKKTFSWNEELKNSIESISDKQNWLVITEFWCGDAAQSVPALHTLAEQNKNIGFRCIYRDENLELMDAFLTNGSRSIPKLISFNEQGEIIFTWGPRPKAAQELVIELKSNPETADTYAEKLHLWYAQNRFKDLQEEFLSILKK